MGYDHSAWLADDGSVWTSGSNSCGQLGLGDLISRNYPSRVPNLPPISSVQSGDRATLCLDTSGNIWSFGQNEDGQLGLGENGKRMSLFLFHHRSSPSMILGMPLVLSFSFYNSHTICLCEDGSLWGFGVNTSGQLGLGHVNSSNVPVQLPTSFFSNEIISVACGYFHTLFLMSKGQVLSCGRNVQGQLGQSDSTDHSTPSVISNIKDCIKIACGGNISCMVDSSYRLWVCGSHRGSQVTPLCFETVGLIQNISVGGNHTLCINQSGELWGWGAPSSGELGNSSKQAIAAPIRIKDNIESCLCLGHSSFIRNNSTEVLCCGRNSNGQLGIGNTSQQSSFSKIQEEHFTICFPYPIQKFSQKSAASAIP